MEKWMTDLDKNQNLTQTKIVKKKKKNAGDSGEWQEAI